MLPNNEKENLKKELEGLRAFDSAVDLQMALKSERMLSKMSEEMHLFVRI